MQTVYGSDRIQEDLLGAVVIIGNFDGVHLGHQKLIQTAKKVAATERLKTLIYTFRPHPVKVLRPESNFKELFPLQDLSLVSEQLDIDSVLVENFDFDFSKISASEFVKSILLKKLKPKAVVIGKNFHFGHQREGDANLLIEIAAKSGVTVHVVDSLQLKSSVISSSRIRQAIQASDMQLATELLGRPFVIYGKVNEGDGRGRKLGFPTANIQPESEVLPGNGVYATQISIDSMEYLSVTNVGVRPTFNSNVGIVIESYILDETMNLYGADVRLHFISKIRDEIKFESADALKIQIEKDVLAARRVLENK